jgi:hypothetical protein
VVQEQIRKTIGISDEGYPKIDSTYLELMKTLDAIDARGRSHVTAALAKGGAPDAGVLAGLASERLAAIKAARQKLDASLDVHDRMALKAYVEGEFRTHVRRYKR